MSSAPPAYSEYMYFVESMFSYFEILEFTVGIVTDRLKILSNEVWTSSVMSVVVLVGEYNMLE